ncbi:AAA family ATPase, partial [Micrococcus luteus]
AQLQSVTAGGAFSFLVRDRDDAPELVDVHRFVNVWEKTASLALRYGRTDVIDTYAEHGRVIGGESEEMIDAAYTAWRTDTLDGRASVLVTDSNESVQALNNRARADLILDGTVNARREVELHDGTRAAAGDTVITRRNDRRLRAGRSWVRNGDRWTVTEVRDDGALTLHRAGRTWGASVVVPAEYAAEHLDLGYAVTSYRAQGITVDSSHVLADASMTRETFYVAMTRGREENIAYVAVDKPDP